MRQVLDCALIVNLGSNSHPKSAYFLSLRIINRFFWKHLYHLCRLCKLDSKWHQVARLALSTSVVIMLFSLPLEKLNMESCRKRITCPMDPMDRMDPMWCPRVKIAARLTKNGCDPENRWVQRLQDDVWTLGRWRAYLSFDKFCWWVYSSTFSGVMFFRAIWCALMWSCTWIVYWIWGMPKWPMWKASCGSSWPSNPCEIGWNYWLNYMKLDVKQNEYPIFNIHLFAIFCHISPLPNDIFRGTLHDTMAFNHLRKFAQQATRKSESEDHSSANRWMLRHPREPHGASAPTLEVP